MILKHQIGKHPKNVVKTLSLRTTPIGDFRDYFSFSHFFPDFLLRLEEKTKFIETCTKFGVKQAIILLSECTS